MSAIESVRGKLSSNLAAELGVTVPEGASGAPDFNAFLQALMNALISLLTGCLAVAPSPTTVATRWQNPGILEYWGVHRAVKQEEDISKDQRPAAKAAAIKTMGECSEDEIRGTISELAEAADWSL